jgi:hypothetical protein
MPRRPEAADLQGRSTSMARLDVAKTNVAVERLLDVTENPRHRYLLEAYNRHRYLEMAGRYLEIFSPEMTVDHPVYRFDFIGQPAIKLDGREQVEALYHAWSTTDQCIFYLEDEELAVSDNMIVSRSVLSQQQLGGSLVDRDVDDPSAMYLARANIAMIWPYDDDGRLLGEDVWEYDDTDRDVTKLDPADVVTVEQSAKVLEALIKPLPARQLAS